MKFPGWLNPARWFRNTAANQGLADAERGLPGPADWREVTANPGEPVRLTFFEAGQLDLAEKRICRLLQHWARVGHGLEVQGQRLQFQFKQLLLELRTHVSAHAGYDFRTPMPPFLPMWVSSIITFLILSGEVVFNASGFAILRMRDIETYTFALGLAVAQTVLATWAGVLVKQYPARRIKQPYSVPCILVGLGFGLLSVPLIVGFLRALYVAYVNKGASEVPLPDFDWSVGAAFFVASLTLEAVAAVGAYMSAASDPELVRIIHDKARVGRLLGKVWCSWEGIAARHDEELSAIEFKISEIQHNVIAVCDEYRRWNRIGDPTRACPALFQQSLTPGLLFQARHLGLFLEHPPAPLNVLLDQVEQEVVTKNFTMRNGHKEVHHEQVVAAPASRNGDYTT